jgi:hypothetical protein
MSSLFLLKTPFFLRSHAVGSLAVGSLAVGLYRYRLSINTLRFEKNWHIIRYNKKISVIFVLWTQDIQFLIIISTRTVTIITKLM